jgi:tetratricopeptide (TPR) repeat protein
MTDTAVVDALLSRATSFHRAGNLHAAAELYERAVAQSPADGRALHLLGVVCTQLGEYSRAISCLRQCAELMPRSSDVANNLGLALYPAGKREEAIASFERALVLKPDNAKAAIILGNLFFKERDLDRAHAAFERALQIKPDYSEARSNLGHCLVIQGNAEEAVRTFEQVLRQNPNYQHAIEGLVSAYRALDRLDEIVSERRKLVALRPQEPTLWVELGVSLQAIDRHGEAIGCFEKALEIDPKCAAAHARIGWAMLESGKMDKALPEFTKACALDPRSPFFWHLLTRSRKVVRGDGSLEALEGLLREQASLPPPDQVFLHFALGKALADVGDDKRSFEHYLEGNRINRSQIRFDEKRVLAKIDRTVEVVSSAITQRSTPGRETSPVPIFVLGMPRTGSTLVEQILAAHPRVVAVGEATALRDVVRAYDAKKEVDYPDWLPGLVQADLDDIGNEYIERLVRVVRTRDPEADFGSLSHVTDKMPGNFLFLGLIHLALPGARVIHTRRDPVETCLSCFRIIFDSLNFTNDLAELGRYYRHYERLMAKWREALPGDLVLDVDYEELVENIEPVARRILRHCGLEWNDACLSFHSVDRPIRTASVTQVRQPLYATSVKGWRPGAVLLKPLLDALRGDDEVA